jgi:hypothetical protein
LGQVWPYGEIAKTSASPPKADLPRLRQFGWKVPERDLIKQ